MPADLRVFVELWDSLPVAPAVGHLAKLRVSLSCGLRFPCPTRQILSPRCGFASYGSCGEYLAWLQASLPVVPGVDAFAEVRASLLAGSRGRAPRRVASFPSEFLPISACLLDEARRMCGVPISARLSGAVSECAFFLDFGSSWTKNVDM